jgi:hypothetical protein
MRRRDVLAILGGGVVSTSAAVRAQQKPMPVIGFLNGVSPGPYAPFVAAFRQGLGEAGYVEGRNVAIEYRWAEGRYERLPELAADLVGRKVDLIATSGGRESCTGSLRNKRARGDSSMCGRVKLEGDFSEIKIAFRHCHGNRVAPERLMG